MIKKRERERAQIGAWQTGGLDSYGAPFTAEQRYFYNDDDRGNEHYSDSPEMEGEQRAWQREGIKWQLRDGMGNGNWSVA